MMTMMMRIVPSDMAHSFGTPRTDIRHPARSAEEHIAAVDSIAGTAAGSRRVRLAMPGRVSPDLIWDGSGDHQSRQKACLPRGMGCRPIRDQVGTGTGNRESYRI